MGTIAAAFERAGLTAAGHHRPGRVASRCAVPSVERALTLLLRQKVLVRVDTLVFHAAALDRLKVGDPGAEGNAGGAAARRRRREGPLWDQPEVRDPVAGVPRPRARDAPGG